MLKYNSTFFGSFLLSWQLAKPKIYNYLIHPIDYK